MAIKTNIITYINDKNEIKQIIKEEWCEFEDECNEGSNDFSHVESCDHYKNCFYCLNGKQQTELEIKNKQFKFPEKCLIKN